MPSTPIRYFAAVYLLCAGADDFRLREPARRYALVMISLSLRAPYQLISASELDAVRRSPLIYPRYLLCAFLAFRFRVISRDAETSKTVS